MATHGQALGVVMIASRLRWRRRRCRGWTGALTRIGVQVAGTERRHAARANTPWHLRFVWRFDEDSAVRRVFAVLVDREETKSDKDHVVHDKVRLDQIYGIDNGMTMSLCSVGVD